MEAREGHAPSPPQPRAGAATLWGDREATVVGTFTRTTLRYLWSPDLEGPSDSNGVGIDKRASETPRVGP